MGPQGPLLGPSLHITSLLTSSGGSSRGQRPTAAPAWRAQGPGARAGPAQSGCRVNAQGDPGWGAGGGAAPLSSPPPLLPSTTPCAPCAWRRGRPPSPPLTSRLPGLLHCFLESAVGKTPSLEPFSRALLGDTQVQTGARGILTHGETIESQRRVAGARRFPCCLQASPREGGPRAGPSRACGRHTARVTAGSPCGHPGRVLPAALQGWGS